MNDEVMQEQEPLTETQRQIQGLHETMHKLFEGVDDITQAQAVASYMGCLMSHSTEWKRLIPGFVNNIIAVANASIAAQCVAAGLPIPTEENSNGSNEEGSKEGSGEAAGEEGSKPEGETQG